MGKGDKKSKRGKIVMGSFGVRRSRTKKVGHVAPKVTESVEGIEILKAPKAEKSKSESTEKKPAEKKTSTKKIKED